VVNDSPVPKTPDFAKIPEWAPRAEHSHSNESDSLSVIRILREASKSAKDLPNVEISDSPNNLKLKELVERDTKPLSDYGSEFASSLKPEMQPEEVLRALKDYTNVHKKEILGSLAGLHTPVNSAFQYEFNKALNGTGYYVNSNPFTNELSLMKDVPGLKQDTEVGKFEIWWRRPGVLRSY
jgi:hypothetical protein